MYCWNKKERKKGCLTSELEYFSGLCSSPAVFANELRWEGCGNMDLAQHFACNGFQRQARSVIAGDVIQRRS